MIYTFGRNNKINFAAKFYQYTRNIIKEWFQKKTKLLNSKMR